MIKRLRWKFIIIAMISLFCVLAVIIATINIVSYNRMVDRADETLIYISKNQGKFPDVPFKPLNPHMNGGKDIQGGIPYEYRFFSVTYSKDGSVKSVITDHVIAIDEASAIRLADRVIEEGDIRGFLGNYRYLVDEGSDTTRVTFIDCSEALSVNRNFITISVSISAVGLFAVFALLYFLSKLITDPVSETIEKQKRFITDAGNELKTPISVIDADAELVEMENGRSEWIDDIRSQTKRLAALTNDLVFLSRMEEDSYKLPFIELPISEIVRERANSFASVFKKNDKKLDICIEEMLTLKGDEKSITQLLSILLDNAVKYSREGDTVYLILDKQGKAICLTVYNRTDNMTKEDCERLFDRFWRGDKSRTTGGGYGLGLSVAKAIVQSHKGKISAKYTDNGYLEITAVFPN